MEIDGRLTIGIRDAVDGVLDHSVDGAVWAPPSRLAVLAPDYARGTRALSCAAELHDFVKTKLMASCTRQAHRRP
jgi:hypothetical protein